MDYLLLNNDDLPHHGQTYTFEGYRYGDTNVSFFIVEMPSGVGPRLHSHPYEEIFIIQEGEAVFTVGAATLEVKAGQIVIVRPGTPHKFVNSGERPLRQVNIQLSKQMITEWLED